MTKLLRFTLLGVALSMGSAAWGLQPQQASDPGNSAQPQNQSGMRRGAQQRKNMAELAQKLNLTDDQKAQFQKIRRNSMQQTRAIRTDSSLTDEQRKQKMLDLHKQSHQEMFGILTSDQKQRLKQIREEHKKQQTNEKSGQQSSAKKSSMNDADDDPFAGMTSDDDGGQV